MLHELNQNWRTALALGLLLFFLGLFYQLLIYPAWRLYRQNGAEIVLLREHITRFRQSAADLDRLERELAELNQSRDAGNYTLQGKSATLAAAALQDRVKMIAANHNAELLSTRVLPFQQQGNFERVAINVSLRVSLAVLQRILYDLENGVPFIIIENALVQTPQSDSRRGQAIDTGFLIVQLDLAGFVRTQ